MSVGPQLPPHLQKLREEQRLQESGSDSDSDECGPKLPSVPCRGPRPSEATAEEDEESSSEDDYGPALPPSLANRSTGASSTGVESSKPDSESDSDDDAIGPRPPRPGETLSSLQAQALDFERRAQSMKDKIEGKDKQVVQRETWMLELPEANAKNFGLGARQFSRKGKTEVGDRSGWTQTPEEKKRKAERGEEDLPTEEEEKARTEYLINKARDEAMDKVTAELKKKRGSESLMEKHEKERRKKEKKEAKKRKNEPKERKPFDRDADLGVNRFDDAQRKLMIKKAGQIDSRFGSGQQKFL